MMKQWKSAFQLNETLFHVMLYKLLTTADGKIQIDTDSGNDEWQQQQQKNKKMNNIVRAFLIKQNI